MQTLPVYRIAPPDVVRIEMLKLVPLPPYRIQVYDVLEIRAAGTMVDQPINRFFLVESAGEVNLGPGYGKVRVKGMTLDECKRAIVGQLRKVLRAPEVSVQLARTSETQPVTGEYLVGPDGTINLRRYGTVSIAGKTLAEARRAVEKQLMHFFDAPKISLDVAGYNSLVYYVITEGPTLGDRVVRAPITGRETVLDALGNLEWMPHPARRKMWIARPASANSAREMVLPVDWEAITRRGSAETNYQILPGDRLMITEEEPSPAPAPRPQ